MRSIEEVLKDRDMTEREFRILNNFWSDIRTIQGRRDVVSSKNRNLVGAALGTRRITLQEIDIETMASLTGLGRSSLQKTLGQMVADDMIFLEKDEDDRRRTLIKPTRKFVEQSLDMYDETRSLIQRVCDLLQSSWVKK